MASVTNPTPGGRYTGKPVPPTDPDIVDPPTVTGILEVVFVPGLGYVNYLIEGYPVQPKTLVAA